MRIIIPDNLKLVKEKTLKKRENGQRRRRTGRQQKCRKIVEKKAKKKQVYNLRILMRGKTYWQIIYIDKNNSICHTTDQDPRTDSPTTQLTAGQKRGQSDQPIAPLSIPLCTMYGTANAQIRIRKTTFYTAFFF